MDEGVDRGEGRLGSGEVAQVGAAQSPRSLADRPLDRHQVVAASQRHGDRLAQTDQTLVGDQSREQHLAAIERAAGGRVGAPERERVGDHLDLGQPHRGQPSPDLASTVRDRPGRPA